MDEAAERELVRRFKDGDMAAFDILVEEHQARVYRLAYRLTGGPQEADALTQDAFVQAFQSLPGFGGRSRFMTWLYAITVRKAVDRRRERARHAAFSLTDRLDPVVDARRPADQDPAVVLREKELSELLAEAIGKLPADQRAALALVVQEGLSYREASKALRCSQGTVAWRVWNARRLLREMLGKHLAG